MPPRQVFSFIYLYTYRYWWHWVYYAFFTPTPMSWHRRDYCFSPQEHIAAFHRCLFHFHLMRWCLSITLSLPLIYYAMPSAIGFYYLLDDICQPLFIFDAFMSPFIRWALRLMPAWFMIAFFVIFIDYYCHGRLLALRHADICYDSRRILLTVCIFIHVAFIRQCHTTNSRIIRLAFFFTPVVSFCRFIALSPDIITMTTEDDFRMASTFSHVITDILFTLNITYKTRQHASWEYHHRCRLSSFLFSRFFIITTL